MRKRKYIALTVCLLLVSSNRGQFVVTDPGQTAQQAMMLEQLITLNMKFVEQSITDKAEFMDDMVEQTKQTSQMGATVNHLKALKAAYDKFDLETIKDIYELVKLYTCVLKEHEILVAVSGNLQGDCMYNFQYKKALAKYNASKEMIAALGLINTGIKLTQKDQMATLKESIELLEQSFNDIVKLNQALKFNLNHEIENAIMKESLLQTSSKGKKVGFDLYEQ